jgi:aquaporin Z
MSSKNPSSHDVVPLWRLAEFKILTMEFVCTFFFVLIIACTKLSDMSVPAMSIGLGLCSIVYIFGPLGGGIVNPAVTLALMIRGKLSIFLGLACMIVQFVGAVTAGYAAYGLYSDSWNDVGKHST